LTALRNLGLAAVFLIAPHAMAQSYGGSASFACYQAALGRSVDITPCNQALLEQNLTPTEMAANYSNRALLLARLSDLPAAFVDHDKAHALEPDNAYALINRANSHYQAEQYTAALVDLDAAIAVGGSVLAVAHFNRGIVHARIGNKEFARQDVEKALRLSPQTDSYRAFLKTLSPSDQNKPGVR